MVAFCILWTYVDVEGAGRGALAAEDLGVGEIALEIPISVVISEDLVYESDMVCCSLVSFHRLIWSLTLAPWTFLAYSSI